MGGPSRPKECLDGQHSPKFFGDKFMIPWAKKVLKSNPNLDDIVLPFLRAEMQRLEEKIKLSKKGPSKAKCGQSSCSARKCGFPNKTVNLTNIGVYGTCGRCAKYEHFRCAKIKDEEKEEINSGSQVFYCSDCLFKFPLEVTFDKPATEVVNTPNQAAIENVGLENNIEVIALVHDVPEQPNVLFQCEVCEFNVELEDEIQKHMNEKHGKYTCNVCTKSFWEKSMLNAHTKNCHVTISIKCKYCDFKAEKLSALICHRAKKHQIKCDQCEWTVVSKKELEQHQKHVHDERNTNEKDNKDEHAPITQQGKDSEQNKKSNDKANEEVNNDEIKQDKSSQTSECGGSHDHEEEMNSLKKELKFVKNRFEQVLESHKDVEKDMEDLKRKYEEELFKAREEFVKVKAEKEHFRVRNELLHNMSKIIVEQCMKKTDKETTSVEEEKDDEGVIEDEEEDDISRFVNQMKHNKSNGYRRVGPS